MTQLDYAGVKRRIDEFLGKRVTVSVEMVGSQLADVVGTLTRGDPQSASPVVGEEGMLYCVETAPAVHPPSTFFVENSPSGVGADYGEVGVAWRAHGVVITVKPLPHPYGYPQG